MNYIGEIQKDSEILLELLTKDEHNQTICADFPPTATIEHYSRNGVIEVDSVTLETMTDGSKHVKLLQIPSHWESGNYIITYKVRVNAQEYTTQEMFQLSEMEGFVQSYELSNPIQEKAILESEQDLVTVEEGYIMPSEFQIPSTISVSGKRLTITLSGTIKYNYTYRVVLDKAIASSDGLSLGSIKTLTYTSAYKPLFATPLEVQSVLRSIYQYFTPHDIYSAIRDAGQKAMTLLGNVADANNSRYRDMRSTDTALFPTQKYVMYEAARSLMVKLMVRILNGSSSDDGDDGMMTSSGGKIQLGDFMVEDKSSSSSGISGSSETTEESPLKKLQTLIASTEKELKFWLDNMMGITKRGYAKPVSSSFRTAAGSPGSRGFE